MHGLCIILISWTYLISSPNWGNPLSMQTWRLQPRRIFCIGPRLYTYLHDESLWSCIFFNFQSRPWSYICWFSWVASYRGSSKLQLIKFTAICFEFCLLPPITRDSHQKWVVRHSKCGVINSYCVLVIRPPYECFHFQSKKMPSIECTSFKLWWRHQLLHTIHWVIIWVLSFSTNKNVKHAIQIVVTSPVIVYCSSGHHTSAFILDQQ